MKVGIIRCQQTEDYCPGTTDFRIIRERQGAFEGFASCIQKGTPIGYPCPFARKMKELIANDLGKSVQFLDYTH